MVESKNHISTSTVHSSGKLEIIANEKRRLRVFWDFENIAKRSKDIRNFVERLRSRGDIVDAYAFADWDKTNLTRQQKEQLHESGFSIISVPSNKKNASDQEMKSWIERYTQPYEVAVIVTNDTGFCRTLDRLRKDIEGIWIIGDSRSFDSILQNSGDEFYDFNDFCEENDSR